MLLRQNGAALIPCRRAPHRQLYENYARSSVDGLSPIFLAQWMGGDVTNLWVAGAVSGSRIRMLSADACPPASVGCLLTHQLGFQIAVATYFCVVDACICAQFYCECTGW